MRPFTVILLSLLLVSAVASAQETSPSQNPTQPATQNPNVPPDSKGMTTIQGCLERATSGYTLKDKSGATYLVSGRSRQLRSNVGKEVEIQGTVSQQTSTMPSGSTNPAEPKADSMIDMSTIRVVSEKCGESNPKR